MSVTVLPKIETDAISQAYGRFVIGPLESGFGVTLGNALRRVMLSSLPGAAITEGQIEGALHEFTTLEGMQEDVIELLLNLKGVAVRLSGRDEATVRLVKKDPGVVTAADIEEGRVHALQDKPVPDDVTLLRIHGPFLFGTTQKLADATAGSASGSSSSSVSTCQVRGWMARQISARCRVLALFLPPTTTMTSTFPASSSVQSSRNALCLRKR